MSECDRLPLNIQIATYASATIRPAGRKSGLGDVTDRPVTIRRIAATIITKGNERNRLSSADIDSGPASPPLIMIPEHRSPQRTSGGLIAATSPDDQPRGGRGSAGASRRPTPRWYTARNQRTAQKARRLAAVTSSLPRMARAQSRYESAWTMYT